MQPTRLPSYPRSMAESLHSLRQARAQLRGSRVALAEELASVIRAVFDAMRAAGVPPDDGDRARARRMMDGARRQVADGDPRGPQSRQ